MDRKIRELLREEVFSVAAPPPALSVSEFADRELVVPMGARAGTRWDTSFAPFQREIMDIFSLEPGTEKIVVQGSAQWGKTSILLNLAGYHMAYDPCPILIVQPNKDMAKDFSIGRLQPLIEKSPALDRAVTKKKSRDSGNTQFQKQFNGGMVAIVGSHSPAGLASRPIRLLLMDEIDNYPAKLPHGAGPIDVALARTKTYMRKKRVMLTSTPSIVDAGVNGWFKKGDMRYYYVPCPGCKEHFRYRWEFVKWDNDDPDTARIECPSCSYKIHDAERVEAVQDGEWRATNPDRKDKTIVSFQMWEAYSPFCRLGEIVQRYLDARSVQDGGDDGQMNDFFQTTLGEPIEVDVSQGIESHVLMLRREVYEAPVPEGAVLLTMGVDVQDNRLEMLVAGWGAGEESWVIKNRTIVGDTSKPGPWNDLEEAIGKQYRHESGKMLPISRAAVDSGGHRTDEVYAFVKRMQGRQVHAIKGVGGQAAIINKASAVVAGDVKRQVNLDKIGVNECKNILMQRLAIEEPGQGYIHLPKSCDEEFCAQLTAERLVRVVKAGRTVYEWTPQRLRNDMLDCWVYAYWGLRMFGHGAIEQILAEFNDPKPAPVVHSEPDWVAERTKDWF